MPNPPPGAPVFRLIDCASSRIVVFAALALIAMTGSAPAQSFLCHVAPDSADALTVAGGAAPYEDGAEQPTLRVAIHTLRDDAGGGGYSTVDVDSLWTRAMIDFAAVGIQILLHDKSDLKNSTYLADPIGNAAAMFAAHADSTCLNIFLGAGGSVVEGTVSGVPGPSLLLHGDAAGTSALSHFLGHCLGLYETDETAFGLELPDGSNSAVAGDLVTDTPPITGATNILEGVQVSGWDHFTPEQGARMRSAIKHVSLLEKVEYAAGVLYVNASDVTLLAGAYSGIPANATAVDFSGDGVLDLAITADYSMFESTGIDLPTGVPVFSEITGSTVPDAMTRDSISTSTGVIAADYDNDGDLDLYLPRRDGHLLLRRQDGVYTDKSELLDNMFYGRSSIGGAWGDYDADGYLDLVVVRPSSTEEGSSALLLYHNDNGTGFTVDTTKGISFIGERLRTVMWADLNFDQRLDLLTVQTGPYLPGPVNEPPSPYAGVYSKYWVQQAGGSFALRGIGGDEWRLQYRSCQAGLMDVEPDGDLDLVYANVNEHGYALNDFAPAEGNYDAHLMCRYHAQITITCPPPESCPESHYRNFVDLDPCDVNLDGRPDYVTPDPDMIPYVEVSIYEPFMEPPVRFTSNVIETHEFEATDQASGGVAVADFDGNGTQDIFVARSADMGSFFYRATPSQGESIGNWIGLRLRSYDSTCNRFGIGASVVVQHGNGPYSYRQAQVVDGGSGGAGQSPLNLVFGLGERAGTVSVEVYWPDGQTVQEYTGLAIGQYHTLQMGIAPSSVGFTRTVDPATGLYDWEFVWDTDNETPAAADRVVATPDPPSSACGTSVISLDLSMPDVSVDVVPVGNRFRHTLVWHDVPCVAPCRFSYVVSSSLGGVTWTLQTAKSLKSSFCYSAP